jgi:hypothetical protein
MILTEAQIRNKIRTRLRTAATLSKLKEARFLAEQQEKSAESKDIIAQFKKLGAELDREIDELEVVDAKKLKKESVAESVGRKKKINESWLVTAYGAAVSASGIANLLGRVAKGIAKILNKIGFKGVDPEKEGKTFFEISEWIHHLYIGLLMKLAAKMGVPKPKQKLAANVMFGVLLGVAITTTGSALVDSVKAAHLPTFFGEGGALGIKAAESAKVGTDISALIRNAFASTSGLRDVIQTAGETVSDVAAT